MKRALFTLVVLLIFGCASKINREDLKLLNGYWEIEKVVFPDGSTKTYSINETVDYLEIKVDTGYRKKVKPRLDGKYEVSADAEPFKILEKEGVFIIQYANNLSIWEEQIEHLNNEGFSVVNKENITYHYKRHQPLLELE